MVPAGERGGQREGWDIGEMGWVGRLEGTGYVRGHWGGLKLMCVKAAGVEKGQGRVMEGDDLDLWGSLRGDAQRFWTWSMNVGPVE